MRPRPQGKRAVVGLVRGVRAPPSPPLLTQFAPGRLPPARPPALLCGRPKMKTIVVVVGPRPAPLAAASPLDQCTLLM
jgi:hypothetical protein